MSLDSPSWTRTGLHLGRRRGHSPLRPGRPPCGYDSMNAVYTDDPAKASGRPDCLELAT